MAEGAMLVWFALTAISLGFVVWDIPKTPEDSGLKWAFVILTLFTGPFGAFFYVLGCREPIKGTHTEYVRSRWRQVLGSTMHCAAGDGLGIIAGAAIASFLLLPAWADLCLEYALGFGFGWTIFQAFAMRDMAGGSYLQSLKKTFLPEVVSMNALMGGMVLTMAILMHRIQGAHDPLMPGFWFVMSMALIVGFAFAYPVNWWLVANNLKHGMFTVREGSGAGQGAHVGHEATGTTDSEAHKKGHVASFRPSREARVGMTVLTAIVLAVAIGVSQNLGG